MFQDFYMWCKPSVQKMYKKKKLDYWYFVNFSVETSVLKLEEEKDYGTKWLPLVNSFKRINMHFFKDKLHPCREGSI